MTILAGDIGGTHTRLAIFNGKKIVKEKKYLSQQFSGLSQVLQDFLTEKVDCACFGIAGPVAQGRCNATNLPWTLDASEIAQTLKIPQVYLINDLEATAWGISSLNESQFLNLNEGKTQKGNQAVIAAGTGLGESGLYWDGTSHHPFPCEGGHVDFAPRDEREEKLLHYLRKKYGHVSYERAISGPGIENLYRFLNGEEETTSFLVTEKALSGQSEICIDALHWFISLYGSEAGNLALKFLAVGGVYIAGGIAIKIAEMLKNGIFMKAFCDKGRFRSFLSSIPVKVVLADDAALLGAAVYVEKKNVYFK
ncbi:MAG: glucokinase [Rhabdochlamydiaceae bacterium]|jgi:glucokinase